MVDADFFDGYLDGGYLPGVEPVTVANPASGGATAPLQARQEPMAEETRASLMLAADARAITWWFAVGQAGYIAPAPGWKVTQADGTVWVVKRTDTTVQTRGHAAQCTLARA